MPQLRDITVDFVSFVPRAAVRDPQNKSEPRRLLLFKREGTDSDEGGIMATATEEMQAQIDKLENDLSSERQRAEKAEADLAELQKDPEGDTKGAAKGPSKAKDGEEVEDPAEARKEDINKDDLPEDVRAFIHKQEQDNAALEARLEKAEKEGQESSEIAKAEREQRVSREYLAKAEDYVALPIAKDELGPLLRAADESIPLTKEQGEHLITLLKAANESIRQGELFKAYGKDGQSGSMGGALDEAQRKAEDIRKSDSSITPAQALERVFKEDPQLQQRYLDEVR